MSGSLLRRNSRIWIGALALPLYAGGCTGGEAQSDTTLVDVAEEVAGTDTPSTVVVPRPSTTTATTTTESATTTASPTTSAAPTTTAKTTTTVRTVTTAAAVTTVATAATAAPQTTTAQTVPATTTTAPPSPPSTAAPTTAAPPAAPETTTAPAPSAPANPGDSRNCGDFSTYADAKSWFDTYYPYYGDVARLDSDGDLEPCESLPGAP